MENMEGPSDNSLRTMRMVELVEENLKKVDFDPEGREERMKNLKTYIKQAPEEVKDISIDEFNKTSECIKIMDTTEKDSIIKNAKSIGHLCGEIENEEDKSERARCTKKLHEKLAKFRQEIKTMAKGDTDKENALKAIAINEIDETMRKTKVKKPDSFLKIVLKVIAFGGSVWGISFIPIIGHFAILPLLILGISYGVYKLILRWKSKKSKSQLVKETNDIGESTLSEPVVHQSYYPEKRATDSILEQV
jgi:hypothetical protein